MTSTPTINIDSLALSASAFTSSISSWLPANFGVSAPAGIQADELGFDLGGFGQNDRLGLGHASLEQKGQSSKAGAGNGYRGLAGLNKLLNLKLKKRREEVQSIQNDDDAQEEEEEEESRFTVGKKNNGRGKTKNSASDPFASKKRKKVSLANYTSTPTPGISRQPSNDVDTTNTQSDGQAKPKSLLGLEHTATPIVSQPQDDTIIPLHSLEGDDDGNTPKTTTPSSSSVSGTSTFPLEGSRASDSPHAKKRNRQAESGEEYEDGEGDTVTKEETATTTQKQLTKNQHRKEKRKRAKLASAIANK